LIAGPGKRVNVGRLGLSDGRVMLEPDDSDEEKKAGMFCPVSMKAVEMLDKT
jgi:hypothetical protein